MGTHASPDDTQSAMALSPLLLIPVMTAFIQQDLILAPGCSLICGNEAPSLIRLQCHFGENVMSNNA